MSRTSAKNLVKDVLDKVIALTHILYYWRSLLMDHQYFQPFYILSSVHFGVQASL